MCAGRAVACQEATARLSVDMGDLRSWVDDALADDGSLAFEMVQRDVRGPAAGFLHEHERVSVAGEADLELED